MTEAPVVVAAHLSPAQVRQYRLMDNRSHDEAKWDPDILTAELLDMRALDLDLSLTGFSSGELDRLLLQPNAGEDDVPPVPDVPVSRLGDLWLCGEHRVLCGDATSTGDAERVCTARKVNLVFTDPPYGVKFERGKYQGNNHGKKFAPMENDSMGNADLESFMREAFLNAFSVAQDDSAIYAWTGCSPKMAEGGAVTLRALLAAGWTIQSQIIWHKTPFVLGRADYHWQHEAAWYGYRGPNHAWYGERDKGTVWMVPKPQAMDLHPTMKPVQLGKIALQNSTQPGDSVYDPFLGSGTTLIAAELTGRICYGLEISPAYVDVIVQRWSKLTGKQATLDGHGSTFEHVKYGPSPRSGRRAEGGCPCHSTSGISGWPSISS